MVMQDQEVENKMYATEAADMSVQGVIKMAELKKKYETEPQDWVFPYIRYEASFGRTCLVRESTEGSAARLKAYLEPLGYTVFFTPCGWFTPSTVHILWGQSAIPRGKK